MDAIRRANPGCKLLRFLATAGNIETISPKGDMGYGYADAWVIVDGERRCSRRDINRTSGEFSISVPLAEKDRFLTLAATEGADGSIPYDWILFGDPRLELATGGPTTREAAAK